MLFNNECVNNEIKKEIKMRTQQPKNIWDIVKAVLRGKFIALQAYVKKQEKVQIHNVTSHIQEPEKEQQTKP